MLHVSPSCDLPTVMAYASSREFCCEHVARHLCAQVIQDWPKFHADVEVDVAGKLLVHEVGFLMKTLMSEASRVLDHANSIGLWQTFALNGATKSKSEPWLVATFCPDCGSANNQPGIVSSLFAPSPGRGFRDFVVLW